MTDSSNTSPSATRQLAAEPAQGLDWACRTMGQPPAGGRPTVSVILPTYNRASFLREAFESIKSQLLADWELIVVDDGSTDNTRELVQDLVERGRQGGNGQSVRYIHQDNQGAYAARNAGLDLAQGKYIAFYDSDDIWLEHHLKDCIDAMEANPDVDCVFAPCQVVDHATGGTIQQNSFYVDGQPWDFLNLRTRRAGALKIIDDPVSTWCTIRHGLAIGPQNSVFHRRIFDRLRFPPYKPIEDQLLEIMVVKSGYRSAYLERIHVVYRVHNDNACCSSAQTSLDKRIEVMTSLADGLEWLRSQLVLTSRESRALRHRLSGIYFWNLGYSLLRHGRRREALPLLRRGLRLHCTNLSFWKTYLLALVGRTPA